MKRQFIVLTFFTLSFTSLAMGMELPVPESQKPTKFALLAHHELNENTISNSYVVKNEHGPFSFSKEKPINFKEAERAYIINLHIRSGIVLPKEEAALQTTSSENKQCSSLNDYLSFPNVTLYGFPIKDFMEKDGHVAFKVSWTVRQQGSKEFNRVTMGTPWCFAQGDSQIESFYVDTSYEAVVYVNMNDQPYCIEGDNIYYGARIFKSLPFPSSNNFMRDSHTEQVIRDIKWPSDFATDEEYEAYRKEVNAAEYQSELNYQEVMAQRAQQLQSWTLESLEKASVS